MNNLTAKQTSLLTALGENFFSFFDDGIVAGSDIWADVMTSEIAGHPTYAVSDTAKGVASVAKSLVKKGYLEVTAADVEDGVAYVLTELGATTANELAGNGAEVAEQEEFDLIGETETPEAPVEVDALDEETGNWISSWTEGDTEWTKVEFSDSSYYVKRRRSVSNAWRTDYYGCENLGEKQVLTTSRQCKLAVAAGSFTF